MTITIRHADLKRDRDELIRFLDENLAPGTNATRFDWLYLASPCGPARAWMALNELGETIGVAAAFPRDFRVADRTERVWVFGDFCIAREHRSLGPALSLQRVCLESLNSRECAICYDFPSQSMLSIYRRLGVPTLGQHVRHVKLLKADEKIRSLMRHGFITSPLIKIANWTLALRRLSESIPKGIRVSLHEGEFGEEFDAMDSLSTELHPVRGIRNARYLNWRYAKNPLRRYRVITARRESDLLGYAVVDVNDSHATLADLQTTDPENTVPGMLSYAEVFLRDMGVNSVNAPLLAGCYLVPYLRRAGYHSRESVPVVAYTRDETTSLPGIHDPNNWFLLYGDRDS